MRTFLIATLALFSINSWAITNAKISELYLSGKTSEITLKEAFTKKFLKQSQWKDIQQNMEKVAQEKSNIWGDTILEGDYSQLEDATLDINSIQAIIFEEKLIGFSAYVKATGAYSGECYDYEDESKFEACLEDFKGEIFEKFIVNKKGYEVEEYFDEGAQFE